MVIGADGLHSLVAREVAPPTYDDHPALTCFYYSYWSGLLCDRAMLHFRERRILIVIPTHEGLACVVTVCPVAEFHNFRSDIEGNVDRSLDLAPELAERVRQGKREERFTGTADLPNFFRRPHGPGWALVGDAGFHKDPLLAQGITDAFRDAGLLAEAIDAAIRSSPP
jgi:2-polyprenyl-6-methoxyphenol hydroxylase-like FAD-dependent oxidoreductase